MRDLIEMPGLFYFLVEAGAVPFELMEPLLSKLPEEKIVGTSIRGGEAYDSTRWPVARDAELTRFAARRFALPELDAALQEIERAAGDAGRLRTLSRLSLARVFASMGADTEAFQKICSDMTPAEAAVFKEPRLSPDTAPLVDYLYRAYHGAADGLFAYHAYRKIPGPSAIPAAQFLLSALKAKKLQPEELVDAAIALVEGRPLPP